MTVDGEPRVHLSAAPRGSEPPSDATRPTDLAVLLGQVMTPESIARHMVRRLLGDNDRNAYRILDPCSGPGTFLRAAVDEAALLPSDFFLNLDIDPSMTRSAAQALTSASIPGKAVEADYLLAPIDPVDAVVMNPPYVRQEWIDNKAHYAAEVESICGHPVPGTSNLYVYFVIKALGDLKPGGRFEFLVYDSWRYTRYGQWLEDRLSEMCDELVVESVGSQPFDGRLIDATILSGTRATSRNSKAVERTTQQLLTDGYTTVDSAFATRRGLRLKQVSFFRCDLHGGSDLGAVPFVKKVATIPAFIVPEDHAEGALLVHSAGDNPAAMSELNRRLDAAKVEPASNRTILNWHQQRPDAWFLHAVPPFAPLIFNYYLRGRPRHIYNPTRPFSDNFYGLTPRTAVSPLAWLAALNSSAVVDSVLASSRAQGNGLSKVQLYEYRGVTIPDINTLSASEITTLEGLGAALILEDGRDTPIIDQIDTVMNSLFDLSLLPAPMGGTTARTSGRV